MEKAFQTTEIATLRCATKGDDGARKRERETHPKRDDAKKKNQGIAVPGWQLQNVNLEVNRGDLVTVVGSVSVCVCACECVFSLFFVVFSF